MWEPTPDHSLDNLSCPIARSPGTHIVGPWVIDSINSYRDLRTGTQYMGNWASRDVWDCRFFLGYQWI